MAAMPYIPPHKRHTSATASTEIIHAAGCISRWSPLPPFSAASDTLRLEPFLRAPIDDKTGARPVALVVASTPGQDSYGPTAAVTAITERFLPDLLDAAKRSKEEGAPKLSLVARLGKVLFHCQHGGSPVSLDTLRQAAEAGEDGSNSQLRTSFYTNVRSKCLDDMESSMVERMGLESHSSKEHYHVQVFDKKSDSTISCKCTVEEDGSLAIRKVELKQMRHLVEDISCLFKGLDLRLMLSKKRILQNLDSEVENAVKSLVSAAVIDPNAKGGITWPLGKESVGERFSIVGVWHTKYKAFRNETMKLWLRNADRFDHKSSSGEVSDEVTFKLTEISLKLEEDDPVENSLKEMLESAVQMVWDHALNYQIVP